MALASYLSNFARNARPPRVTSRRSQPTTASSVRVAGRVNQPTTRATPRPIAWHDPLHGARPAAVTGPPLPTAPAAVAPAPAPVTFANLAPAQLANDTGFNQNENSLERALIGFLTNNQGAQNRARSAYETGVAQAMADRVVRAQQDLANNPPVVPDVGAAAGVVDMSGAVNAPVANASAAAQRASAAAGLRRRRALRGARIGRI
jgi:hypothetical protein